MIEVLSYEDSSNAVLALVLKHTHETKSKYFEAFDIPLHEVAVAELSIKPKEKKADLVEYLNTEVIPAIDYYKVKYVMCAHAETFKVLADRKTKVTEDIGYVHPIKGTEAFIVYVPDVRSSIYNPVQYSDTMRLAMHGLLTHVSGVYKPPGSDIAKNIKLLKTDEKIIAVLEDFIASGAPLTCDTEAFDLKHYKAGLGTITFCTSETEGVAFSVDYMETGVRAYNSFRRALLKDFFIRAKNKIIYHNASFDVTLLISQLFMESLLDTEGMLKGIQYLLNNFEDTKIIAYLATNSCAESPLGLKYLSHEFTGKYSMEEIKDITKVDVDDLLKYNGIDGLATWFVFNKYYPAMVADNQEELYKNLFRPILIDIVQMQLTGMPICMDTTKKVADKLYKYQDDLTEQLLSHPVIASFTEDLIDATLTAKQAKLKKKVLLREEIKTEFNDGSPQQKQKLLYEFMGLPVIELTKTQQPSTSKDTLLALLNHTDNPEFIEVLKIMLELADLSNILSTFIPAFLAAPQAEDGWHYVFGNFNLGGTVSGRLSSSKINLQNLPATKSRYAKDIKSCFQAPPGWIFVGLDYDSLEDKISALTTKDPNKLKVYTDGFDGHCLRAYGYWPEQMPDIDPTSVESINSIADKYKEPRQKSKTPTFALTYLGTWRTLMKKCGFTEKEAKNVEKRFKTLYAASIAWVAERLREASRTGYIEAAFGLRIRTPILAKTILNSRSTPKEAAAESRTAGNALGQSWCLLNNRSQMAFMRKVRDSEFRLDIRPCGSIHDAQYYMVRENIHALKYVNDNLIPEVAWQDHPLIQHDIVKLSGSLDVFFPSWAENITLPHGASIEDIYSTIDTALKKRKEKK